MSHNKKKRSHLSPHDRYLRGVMVDPKIAQDFLKNNLPFAIQSLVDLDTIELQKDSFINDRLQQQVADLLYTATIQGKPGYIYLLLEHASKPDRLLPFRMLKYIIEIMDTHLTKTGKAALPVVYPLILYTGRLKHP